MRLTKKKKKRKGDEQWDSSVTAAEAMPVSTSCSGAVQVEGLKMRCLL